MKELIDEKNNKKAQERFLWAYAIMIIIAIAVLTSLTLYYTGERDEKLEEYSEGMHPYIDNILTDKFGNFYYSDHRGNEKEYGIEQNEYFYIVSYDVLYRCRYIPEKDRLIIENFGNIINNVKTYTKRGNK